jgi:hypothetical protein
MVLMLTGCASIQPRPESSSACIERSPVAVEPSRAPPAPLAVLRQMPLDPAVEERILALDPERISDEAVRNSLACGPTPQIMNLHGGIYPVHLAMRDFAGFLIDMGYPQQRIRDPGTRDYSYMSCPG